MNQIEVRTVSIGLELTSKQRDAFERTMQAGMSIFNIFTKLCIEHKSCSYMTLHKFGYSLCKEKYPKMPTALIQTFGKSACSSVKSFNSNNKKQKWNYKGKSKSFSIPLNVLTLSKRNKRTTIASVDGRQILETNIPNWFIKKYDINVNKIQAGTLNKNKHGVWKLNLQYKVIPKDLKQTGEVVGIDRGLYNIAATSKGDLFGDKHIAIKRRYQFLRSQLQRCGTKSAKRHLKKLSGRETRFIKDVNNVITKKLAQDNSVQTYVLEDLRGIRKQQKGKKINSWISNWSFAQFESMLRYKCKLFGINVVNVSPEFTSQKCNKCGHIHKENRNGGIFKCVYCGYKTHADINAAKNIRDKYYALASTKDTAFSTVESLQPLVSNNINCLSVD